MTLIAGLLAGLLIGAGQAWIERKVGSVVDLFAVALATLALAPPRAAGVGCWIGLLLGFSTWSMAPVGALLLGGGLAALALDRLRSCMWVERRAVQALFGVVSVVALRVGIELYSLAGRAVAPTLSRATWLVPLLSAIAVPILAASVGVVMRGGRRLVEWVGARRGRGGPPSS